MNAIVDAVTSGAPVRAAAAPQPPLPLSLTSCRCRSMRQGVRSLSA